MAPPLRKSLVNTPTEETMPAAASTRPMMPATQQPRPPESPAKRPAVIARDLAELRAGLVGLVPELRSRALRLCGSPATADDLVQDTIERALRFAGQYERGTNLRAWAQQILFSVFVTRWRRVRRERRALEHLTTDPCA